MEKCYMLFNDEKIYIKSNKSSNVVEYTINDSVSILMYHYILTFLITKML